MMRLISRQRILTINGMGGWVLAGIGVVFVIAGILIGLLPHPVMYAQYKPVGNHKLELYYLEDKTLYYLHEDGTKNYYAIRLAEFRPQLKVDTFDQAVGLSYLWYETDKTQVNAREQESHQSLAGDLYPVVKLVLFARDGTEKVYTTDRYAQGPDGYIVHDWLKGSIVLGVGVVLLIVTFVMGRRKRVSNLSTAQLIAAGADTADAPEAIPVDRGANEKAQEQPLETNDLSVQLDERDRMEPLGDAEATILYKPDQGPNGRQSGRMASSPHEN